MVRNGFISNLTTTPAQSVVAYISVKDHTYDSYVASVRKYGHASAAREAHKAVASGLFCEIFPRRLYIPDIHAINTSAPARGGKPMSANYQRSIEEMGGAPRRHIPVSKPICPIHNQTYFGVFQKVEGHRQGDVVTNQQLLAYVSVNRYGNCAIYTLFLGHHEYRKRYVMNLLHFETMRALTERSSDRFKGLDYLMYHRYVNTNPGLTFWKRKMNFSPGYWVNVGLQV
jgi:hypothetical protein